jgi:hypothetical protein
MQIVSRLLLEHFHKYCSHSVRQKEAAVLLGFGFVFAQLQAAAGMLLRLASPKHQNSSPPNGHSISSKALAGTLSFALFSFTGCQATPPAQTAAAKTSEVDLFNGQNFDGWAFFMKDNADPTQTWSVTNGVIHCTGKPFGYARTTQAYHDYKLTCVWRFVKLDPTPKVNNSGIFVHIQPPDVVFPEAIQCQGLYQHQGDLILEGGASSDGHEVGKKNVTIAQLEPQNEHPAGDWNTNEIICISSNITLSVNGKVMNQITGCNLTSGYAGIQSEGGDIEIRKFSLQPVK